MRAPVRRALLLALACVGACASWHPMGGTDPAASIRTTRWAPRSEVRVFVTGQAAPVVVGAPRVVGDSLIGSEVRAPGDRNGPRVAVPLVAITRAEQYRLGSQGAVGHVLLVVGVLVAGSLLLMLRALDDGT